MLLHHLWELPFDSIMALVGALEIGAQRRFERWLREDRARLARIASDYEFDTRRVGYLPPISERAQGQAFHLAPGQTYDWRMYAPPRTVIVALLSKSARYLHSVRGAVQKRHYFTLVGWYKLGCR